MNKKFAIPLAIGLIALVWFGFNLTGGSSATEDHLRVTVKKGQFVVDITTTGELEAKKSVKINGPSKLRAYRIWQVTVQEMIDEGTFVKKGDFIARLDPSEITNKISESQIEFDKYQSQYTQTQLDTTLQMRETRDQLINMQYDVEEKQLVLDQSKFEPPATIKKSEIDLEKAKRTLTQATENYVIKRRQNEAKMDEVSATLRKQRLELEGMQGLLSEFTIMAPEDGMLIYYKTWNGVVKTGSQIQAWNPVVATLPDLSIMLSQTYVNEVDIRKIKKGQNVEIGLDAFPDKKLKGKVIKVANVGEQRPNSDAKVFQVSIELEGTDDLIKPAMTTSNRIIVETYDESLYIPLECLNSQYDSITYVYKKTKLSTIKQEVKLGSTNNNEVIVLAGLEAGDIVFLARIEDMDDEKVVLLPEMDGIRNPKNEDTPKQTADQSQPKPSLAHRQ